MDEALKQLGKQLDGELFFDITMRTLYATDASAYREMPLAVAIPRSVNDIKKLIQFAKKEKTSSNKAKELTSFIKYYNSLP